MLTVDTYIDESPVHGRGIYAAEPIGKGELVWRFGGADYRITRETASLNDLHYGYVNPDKPDFVVKCGDEARFWNFGMPGARNCHASTHKTGGEYDIVASRDIRRGEELLICLNSDADAARKLML